MDKMSDTKDKILAMIDFEIRFYEKTRNSITAPRREREDCLQVIEAFQVFRAKVEKEDCI